MYRRASIGHKHMLISHRGNLDTIRHYPGEFKARVWNITSTEAEKLKLEKHEKTHVNIIDNKTKRVVGIFTSSHGNNNSLGLTFDKLSEIKYDNTFVPLKNPVTKQEIVDDYGNHVPHPIKAGQFIVILKTQRFVSKAYDDKFQEKPELQSYLDRHESKLKEIFVKHGGSLPVKQIGNIDEE